jgi:outer membrane protein OmpA-like peptidoglycan-associated protein
MKTITLMACGLILTLAGTGCATKKYVAKTVSPIEARVSQTEGKNNDQDKALAGHGTQIEELDRDLSRTKEKLNDTDSKATAAGRAAGEARDKAEGAQRTADGAAKSADNARGLAETGIERTNQLERTVVAMNKFQMLKSESVLFPFGQSKLNKDAQAQLEALAKTVAGMDRYVIEIQGYTDKTGSPTFNEKLSDERAQAVARFLANKENIPVRSITTLGSGAAAPVGDDKTREGRKMNRRVEVRVFVPEASASGKTTTATVK